MAHLYSMMTLSELLFLLIIFGALLPVCIKNYEDDSYVEDPEKWQLIGFYNGKKLYEQTYSSGKRAWRFREDGDYVYPRKRDVAKNMTGSA